MTYGVTDRVARITFDRPDKDNAIVADTPLELSALVERADLDRRLDRVSFDLQHQLNDRDHRGGHR